MAEKSFDERLKEQEASIARLLASQDKLLGKLTDANEYIASNTEKVAKANEARTQAEEARSKAESTAKEQAQRLEELGKQLEELKKAGGAASPTAQKFAEKVGEKSVEKLFEELNKAKTVSDGREAFNKAQQEFLKKMRDDKALDGEIKEQFSMDRSTFYWSAAAVGVGMVGLAAGIGYVCYEKGRERGHTDMMDATVTLHSRGESNGMSSRSRH